MWEDVLKFIGGGSVVIITVAWLIKALINNILSKDVEAYKTKLKAEYDFKIEEFRTELHKTAYEHEIRFSRLHDKRAKIIADFYGLLDEAVGTVERFVHPVELVGDIDRKQKYEKAMDTMIAMIRYYRKHKIFFSSSLCKIIDNFIEKIWKPTMEFSTYVVHGDDFHRGTGKDKLDAWMKAWDFVSKNDVPPAKAALEDEFRKILGVES